MQDKSYAPIESGFQMFMLMFPANTVEQIAAMRHVFFAGASTMMAIVREHRTDLTAEEQTAYDELEDFVHAFERR